jgi:predicted permease
MRSLLNNLQYGFRQLPRSPGFTMVAVLTLTLGIGANTAIFSVLYAGILRPLPFAAPGQLVHLGTRTNSGYLTDNLTPQMAEAAIERTHSFSSVAVTFPSVGCNMSGAGSPEYVPSANVSRNFFSTFGVTPSFGRDFLAGEESEAGPALISYRLWRSHFAGDRGAVGKQIWCNGFAHNVIGVLPPTFRFSRNADVWLSDRFQNHAGDDGMNYTVFARLRPHVPSEHALADLAAAFAEVRRAYPREWFVLSRGFGLEPYRRWESKGLRTPLWILFGSVGVVLLIACANVISLLLARYAARTREIALRLALGARPGHILRQSVTEALILSVLGAVAGLLVASWCMAALKSLVPARAQFFSLTELDVSAIHLSLPVLGFAAALGLLAGLFAGVVPALAALSAGVYDRLKQSGPLLARPHELRKRKILLVVEVALAVILFACAALLVRSFRALESVPLGFEPRGLQIAEVSLASKKYLSPAAIWQFDQKIIARLRALPGILGVATVSSAPLESGLNLGPPSIRGRQCLPDVLEVRALSPDYFRVMGIPILKGRSIADSDVRTSGSAVVINETFARLCWPKESPIESQFQVPGDDSPAPLRVVGVAGDVHEYALDLPVPPIVYIPQSQIAPGTNISLYHAFGLLSAIVIRTSGHRDVSLAVRHAVEAIDPEQAIVSLAPMTDLVSQSTAFRRMLMLLMGTFAFLALILAAIGLYGLLSYHVAQRTHEIGLRMAIGANPADVVEMVVREGLLLVTCGSAAGVLVAIFVARLFRSLLFAVSPGDPCMLAGAPAALLTVGVLASLFPARRAAKVDPMVALRYQ